MPHLVIIKTKYAKIIKHLDTKFEAMLYIKTIQKEFDIVSYEIKPLSGAEMLQRSGL
jgi:hypothetical protein